MPRNVRNFWIELNVDGKRTRIATGPRNKDGGFELTVYQRDKGDVRKALYLSGYAHSDGLLRLTIDPDMPVRTYDDSASGSIVTTR